MIGKRVVASLVGGIIIFVWQAASWMFLGIHDEDGKYHPQQDQILGALSSAITEEGTYRIPTSPKNASEEEQQQFMKEWEGKPFATVTYVKSYNGNMTRSMIRGFLVDVFLVYLLIYIFTRGGTPPFLRIVAACISAGLFTWLWGPYTEHIWYQLPWSTIQPHLFDAIIAWGICGIWLGWFLNRGRTRA